MKHTKLFLGLVVFCIFIYSCTKESNQPAPHYTITWWYGIDAATVYNGNLIVSGPYVPTFGTSQHIAQWNGISWQAMGGGVNENRNLAGWGLSFITYNGNLIMSGIDSAGGMSVNAIAQWNGASWSSIGTGINGNIVALATYNGNLVASGNFKYAGSIQVNYIAQWNGSTWQSMNNGTSLEGSPYLFRLVPYSGNLLVAGAFDSIGGQRIPYVAQWNGSTWSFCGGKFNTYPECLINYNGNVLALQNFDSIGSNKFNSAAQWNGTSWTNINGWSWNQSIDFSLVYNGTLYLGIDDSILYEWKGNNTPIIAATCSSTTRVVNNFQTPTYIRPLCIYNGNLIVGGWFTSINGVPCNNNLAQWDGMKWSSPF